MQTRNKDHNAPVNILPARGGGGHTRGFRQKTIPDRREFDKLMESGSRVIQTLAGFTSRDLMHQAGSRVGIQTKIVVSRVGIQTPNILRCQIPLGQPAAPPDGQNIDRCIIVGVLSWRLLACPITTKIMLHKLYLERTGQRETYFHAFGILNAVLLVSIMVSE